MDISVIIPTHNRAEMLENCLASISEQEVDADFEVIIFDDNSDSYEEIEQIVQSSSIDVIKLLRSNKNIGPGQARNRAVKYASGKFLVFTDDDTEPCRGWLRELYEALSNGSDVVEGKVIPQTEEHSIFDAVIENHDGNSFMTANMAYKKSVFEKIGGFYSGFNSPFREDSDLAFTAIEQGYDCDFLPEAIVKHPTSKKKLTHIMFETKVFRYDMLLFKRHPELYKKHITAPVEMFTVSYISSLLLTYWFRLSVCLVPLISAMEGRSRGREFSLVDSILYGFAKMVSSCVLVISVVIGAIQYKVNPMNLFRNT